MHSECIITENYTNTDNSKYIQMSGNMVKTFNYKQNIFTLIVRGDYNIYFLSIYKSGSSMFCFNIFNVFNILFFL